MRRFFRLLLPALVLVMIFLVSAMTAMRMAIHGRETAIPKFIGMTALQAEQAATAQGLLLDFESRFYSAEVPEGRVLSQAPAPGEKVRRGWKVRLAQSLGPQRVAIPNVVGQSPRAAEINLTRRGLEVGSVATLQLPDLPPDQIVAQSPQPGAEGVISPKVNLLLTAPADSELRYYVMPNFIGRRFGEATSALAEAGLRVGAVRVTATTPTNARLRPIATDTVSAQSPGAGQKVGAGAAVNFDVLR